MQYIRITCKQTKKLCPENYKQCTKHCSYNK